MNTRLAIGWAVVLGTSAAIAVPSVLSYRHAARAVERARLDSKAADQLRAEADSISRTLPPWARLDVGRGDEPALAQKFAGAVTASGLPASAVESFTPTPKTVIDIAPGSTKGPAIVRARASGVLSGVTLPQLGRALAAWRTSDPDWTITQIDLTPMRLSPTEAVRYAGADLPLRVSLSIERLAATGLDTLAVNLPLAPSPESKDVSR